jgi:hydrogenase maturation protease
LEKEKDILILGLGSDILMDDGIGVGLLSFFRTEFSEKYKNIDYTGALIGGMDLIELIRDYKKVIIIDGIKTNNGIPGYVYLFNKENFIETLHLSVEHDMSFHTALKVGETLGINITQQIHIIAVEVAEFLTLGDKFSIQIQEKFDDIKSEVRKVIEQIIKLPYQ